MFGVVRVTSVLEGFGDVGSLCFGNGGFGETGHGQGIPLKVAMKRREGHILATQLLFPLIAPSSEPEQMVTRGCKVSYAM